MKRHRVAAWVAVLMALAAVVFAAWLFRYDRWETAHGEVYVLDRWTGELQECVDGECHLAY